MTLPNLPIAPSGEWSAQVLQAANALEQIYNRAIEALQTQSDVPCLQYYIEKIDHEAISLLHALETVASHGEVALEWVLECAACFGIALHQLEGAQKTVIEQ